MTERKFTPPETYPAEYVTSDGFTAVIAAYRDWAEYCYVGWIDNVSSIECWDSDGTSYWKHSGIERYNNLHDIPKKQVHWANDYGVGSCAGYWHDTRSGADNSALYTRIAVIRREIIEGQPPQYFTEEV